jgi:hypothetical protein
MAKRHHVPGTESIGAPEQAPPARLVPAEDSPNCCLSWGLMTISAWSPSDAWRPHALVSDVSAMAWRTSAPWKPRWQHLALLAALAIPPTTGLFGHAHGSWSNRAAFAALDKSGSILAWGNPLFGGSGAPKGSFTDVFSSTYAFAALDASGAIRSWGHPLYGGTGEPNGTGFIAVFSTTYAFAALDASGAIRAWGDPSCGGSGAPAGTGFISIFSTYYAFAALDNSGAIHAWGDPLFGGSGAKWHRLHQHLLTKGID